MERPISFAAGGQSVAQMFRMFGKARFNRTLRELVPSAPHVHIWNLAHGGTVAASTNVNPVWRDRPERYWWDMAADAPSPMIVEKLTRAVAFEKPCDCLFWDLGQFEAGALKGKHDRDPDAARDDYRHAMRKTLDHIRERLCPDDPERLPILLMPHAPHPGEGMKAGIGVQRVRTVQYELIATIPNCFDAGIVRGMEMTDNMHPSKLGIQLYAQSVAATFARSILPLIRTAGMSNAVPNGDRMTIDQETVSG